MFCRAAFSAPSRWTRAPDTRSGTSRCSLEKQSAMIPFILSYLCCCRWTGGDTQVRSQYILESRGLCTESYALAESCYLRATSFIGFAHIAPRPSCSSGGITALVEIGAAHSRSEFVDFRCVELMLDILYPYSTRSTTGRCSLNMKLSVVNGAVHGTGVPIRDEVPTRMHSHRFLLTLEVVFPWPFGLKVPAAAL